MSVLVLHWMYSTQISDQKIPVSALLEILEPRHPIIKAYAEAHPIPRRTSLAPRIFLGAASSLSAPPIQKSEAVVSAFTTHFGRLNGNDAMLELELLFVIYALSEKSEPTFCTALCKAASFWRNLFRLLRRSIKNDSPDSRGQLNGPVVVSNMLGLVAMIIEDIQANRPKSRDILVNNWIEGGLFDVLDEGIQGILLITDGKIFCAYTCHTVFSLRRSG